MIYIILISTMVLADAFIPIFTLGSLLFIMPILAILTFVLLLMKRRKLAFRLLLAIPFLIILGMSLDYWMLESSSKERKRRLQERQKREQQLKDSSIIVKDTLLKS